MPRLLTGLVLVALLTGCGDEQASKSAAPAPAAASATAESAAAAPAALPAAVSDEELVYEPIDTGKLDNQWWKQYSGSP